nr:hypothetical protein [Tanacetum cinerariifolium]
MVKSIDLLKNILRRPGRLQKKCVKDWRPVPLSHCFLICLLFMIPRLQVDIILVSKVIDGVSRH